MMLLALVSGCVGVKADDSGEPAEGCSGGESDAAAGSDGFAVGAPMPVASLVDDRTQEVCTSQFQGAPWVLNLRPMSSLPCQEVTGDIGAIVAAFDEYRVIVVTLVTTDLSGDAPTSSELADFAETIGVDAPVLADPAGAFSRAALGEDSLATFYLMDADSAIVGHEDCYTTSEVCAAVSAVLDLEPGLECL